VLVRSREIACPQGKRLPEGGNSELWLRHSAKSLSEILPDAQYRTLDGQNHSATFMAPQAFVPVLVQFFGP
jgi:hypothetical protein